MFFVAVTTVTCPAAATEKFSPACPICQVGAAILLSSSNAGRFDSYMPTLIRLGRPLKED